jgi:RNA polymerase sigma factor (sigma-70 family)
MAHTPTSDRTTDPELLDRVRDWRDNQAWERFVIRHEPRLRAVCRAYGLTGESADDCCQQVWIKLASAIRRFHYDPGRRFRYWLLRFFHCRVRDVLRASRPPWIERSMVGDVAIEMDLHDHDADEPSPEIAAMLARAEAVQAAVRARVAPKSWEIFHLVAIEGQPIADVARSLSQEYTTVYRNFKRVSRMIDDERRRRPARADEPSPG